MTCCNPVDTPMEQNNKLLPGKPNLARDVTKYRSIVGSLRYLVKTRPDIAFAVRMVSRFMESPTSEHWAAIKRIVRYIAGTSEYGCKYEKKSTSGLKLLGYFDSDHAGDLEKRKSTSVILFFLNDNVVTWTSQKQRVVSLSSYEAEYIAASFSSMSRSLVEQTHFRSDQETGCRSLDF
ncbi:secreted RxLR effector protein 161-like [Miscanthus floridulus]|uniref:secreted RxLR effector protein 161-like n=1 Tax=Miscanthus floridulus TaxID=154761 RepID=UPI00345801C8